MDEYLILMRLDLITKDAQPSPEQLQIYMKRYQDWVGGIAAQNKLVDRGNRLVANGKVVRPNNVVTDGPYTEIKELIGGYTLIKAESLDEATELAKGCPVLSFGGNVEVREINPL